MMFETKPVRITELAKETEQYLLQKGHTGCLQGDMAQIHGIFEFRCLFAYSRRSFSIFDGCLNMERFPKIFHICFQI